MGLFNNKNPNEAAYAGGKKHFTDVIKNTGDGNYLLWRQPEEDFNNNSTLIVMPGEEAIFVNGGNIEQVFTSGTYKLNTNNYPFISRLRNSLSGGISTFNCVVYYISKSVSTEIRWGTDTPVQVRDPIFQIACDVRARGAYKIEVEDSAKFLTKLIGSNIHVATRDDLKKFFRSEFMMHIKANLARAIKESGEELIGINSKQDVVASILKNIVDGIFKDYGIFLQSFAIESIDVVDNENRQKLENAISDRGVFGILGENWDKQKQFELMSNVTQNQSVSQMAMTGVGIGLGFGMGNGFGQMANGMMNSQNGGVGFSQGANTPNPLDQLSPQQNQAYAQQQNPAYAQQQNPAYAQQQNPAYAQQPPVNANEPQADPVESLKKLKQMLELDLITQDMYNQKLAEIMSKM